MGREEERKEEKRGEEWSGVERREQHQSIRSWKTPS